VKDPRDQIISAIDVNAIRIRNPARFIFFCGGSVSNAPDVEPPTSMRDLCIRWLKKNASTTFEKICLAEKISERVKDHVYKRDPIYTNLIDLETDLAKLADLIVLIVESPGSIAELGAFSVVDDTRKKIQVFIREERFNADSFITLGPVRYLQVNNRGSVRAYWWATKSRDNDVIEHEACSEIVQDICQDIIKADVSSPASDTFNK